MKNDNTQFSAPSPETRLAHYEILLNVFREHIARANYMDADGICFNLWQLCKKPGQKGSKIYIKFQELMTKLYPELSGRVPHDAVFGDYWFSLNEQGFESRITLIQHCITEVKMLAIENVKQENNDNEEQSNIS